MAPLVTFTETYLDDTTRVIHKCLLNLKAYRLTSGDCQGYRTKWGSWLFPAHPWIKNSPFNNQTGGNISRERPGEQLGAKGREENTHLVVGIVIAAYSPSLIAVASPGCLFYLIFLQSISITIWFIIFVNVYLSFTHLLFLQEWHPKEGPVMMKRVYLPPPQYGDHSPYDCLIPRMWPW